MANWNEPVNSSVYANVLDLLKSLVTDAATMFLNTPSNQPTGSIRFNRATALFEEWNGSAWVAKIISVAGGGTGSATAAGARTNLGLGTMATQNSNSVAITGGTVANLASSGTLTHSGSPAALTTGLRLYGKGFNDSEWVDVAYLAANFTGNGAMTWTVDVGDVIWNNYTIIGKTMIWNFRVVTSSVGGTPNTELRILIPGGFTAKYFLNSHFTEAAEAFDNGIPTPMRIQTVDATHIAILRKDGANFSASTNLTFVAGQIILAID